jgi:hypothetical protein
MFQVVGIDDHPGNVWFVDSGDSAASDAAGFGRSPDSPVATLDYIVASGTANNGDVIYVMPGHAETQSTAASLFALDVAGISVIGLGKGAARPTFTFTHTGAVTTISAASVHLENVVFVCGVDSVAAPLTISAADCSLKDVEFRDTTDVEFVVGVTTTAAADRLVVDGFIYNGYTGGNACTIGISLVGCDGARIENSVFYGEFSTACIDFTTTACSNVTVKDCVFYNDNTALSKNIVDTATGSTWQVVNGYDGKGDYYFSGGDNNAVAAEDLGALVALVGTANATTTDSLHGKIGTDTEMADASLYDMLGAVNTTTTDAINGKIGTDTEMGDLSLYDMAVGTSGTTIPGLGTQVTKANSLAAANDDVFDVTGKVLVTLLTGQVDGAALSGAESFQLRVKTSNEPLCAATTIDTDADGTIYLITGDVGAAMNGGDAPTANVSNSSGVPLVPLVVGQDGGSLTIESNTTGNGGTIDWILYYYPLEASASVSASA